MQGPRIFKLPKHRQFDYQPLYYDPEKEERETRIKEIKAELGLKLEGKYSPGINRGSMRHYIKNQKRVKRNMNIRLAIILTILFLFAYFLLYR